MIIFNNVIKKVYRFSIKPQTQNIPQGLNKEKIYNEKPQK